MSKVQQGKVASKKANKEDGSPTPAEETIESMRMSDSGAEAALVFKLPPAGSPSTAFDGFIRKLFRFFWFALAASLIVSVSALNASSDLATPARQVAPSVKKSMENQTLAALQKYGKAQQYGFQKTELLRHDILGFYNYKYLDREAQLVIAYTKPIKNYECHACAPKLSFFVFGEKGGQYEMMISQINALSFGSWGDSPSRDEIKVVELGKDSFGFTIEGGGTGQGWNQESINIFLPIEGKFQQVLYVETSSNNGGTGSDVITDWTSTISYKEGSGTLYDIVVQTSGVDDNKKFSKTTTYIFDGKKYVSASVSEQNQQNSDKQRIGKSQKGSLKSTAFEMMTGMAMSNDDEIIVKKNSKGVIIYCLSDMSMCKTESEVTSYGDSASNR